MTKTDYLPLEEDFEIQYVRPEAKNLYENGFPQPATPFSAGCDLAACLMEKEIFLEKEENQRRDSKNRLDSAYFISCILKFAVV